mgnify:CR=1 FL=1
MKRVFEQLSSIECRTAAGLQPYRPLLRAVLALRRVGSAVASPGFRPCIFSHIARRFRIPSFPGFRPPAPGPQGRDAADDDQKDGEQDRHHREEGPCPRLRRPARSRFRTSRRDPPDQTLSHHHVRLYSPSPCRSPSEGPMPMAPSTASCAAVASAPNDSTGEVNRNAPARVHVMGLTPPIPLVLPTRGDQGVWRLSRCHARAPRFPRPIARRSTRIISGLLSDIGRPVTE